MKVRKTIHNTVCLIGIGSLLSMISVFGILATTKVIRSTVKGGESFRPDYGLIEKIEDNAVKAGWLSVAGLVGAVLLGKKTAKAVGKAQADEELRRTFGNNHQHGRVIPRESVQTETAEQQHSVQEYIRQLSWELHDSQFSTKRVKPLACQGCKHYNGSSYGGNLLICGLHPYGPGDESESTQQPTSCEDWEANVKRD